MDNRFLFYDSKDDIDYPFDYEQRLIFFCSDFQMHVASTSVEGFADGTYKACPRGFACLYTIHVLNQNETFPIAFILLPNETYEVFNFVVTKLKNVLSNIKLMHNDCQRAAYNAFEYILGCEIKLCLFHLNQSLFKKIARVGLATEYKKDLTLYSWCRRLMAPPFLPPYKIKSVFIKYFKKLAVSGKFGVNTLF